MYLPSCAYTRLYRAIPLNPAVSRCTPSSCLRRRRWTAWRSRLPPRWWNPRPDVPRRGQPRHHRSMRVVQIGLLASLQGVLLVPASGRGDFLARGRCAGLHPYRRVTRLRAQTCNVARTKLPEVTVRPRVNFFYFSPVLTVPQDTFARANVSPAGLQGAPGLALLPTSPAHCPVGEPFFSTEIHTRRPIGVLGAIRRVSVFNTMH